MPVDRKIFKIPFHKDKQPEWICPTCNKAILKGVKGSFIRKETKDSIEAQNHPDWEPEWIRANYSCQFVCTNPTCEETVFNIGVGLIDYEYLSQEDELPERKYFDVFYPKFFIPHLNIFQIAEDTPKEIRSSIEKSFELFFANPSASANHLRIALEQLCDYLKIKKFVVVKGEKFRATLHHRINLIPSKFSEFKELFFAIKWLGNDASHVTGVSVDDVIDAYDIFEAILDEIFAKKSKKTKRLAHKINKNRS